jgi:hypothetical protein
MAVKRRDPRVRCKHCRMTFPVPERLEAGPDPRVQLQCPRKQCGEWSWYERHEIGLGEGRVT